MTLQLWYSRTTLLVGLIELAHLSQELCLFCLDNIMRERERETLK